LANDVEIRERGLDHDDVGAFFEIKGDLFEGFAGVGGVHLIATAIAKLRRGLSGFAEGAVETRAVFGGVGEDGHVFAFVGVEFGADGGYAAVHHVGGRDDVGPGAGMREGLLGEDFKRGVVGDFSVFDDAAVAVIGVFAEADVGNDQEIEFGAADGFDGF